MRLLLTLLLLLPGLAPAQDLQTFLKQAFEDYLRENPEDATFIGRHEYDTRWDDWSKAGRDRRYAQEEGLLTRLNQWPQINLPSEDGLTIRLLQFDLRQQLDSSDAVIHLLRLKQQGGFHSTVYLVIDTMPARTVHDYENILARLRAVPAYVDQNIGILDEALARGITQPANVVNLVSGQIAAQLAQSRDDTPLLAAFRRFPSTIPAAEQARLRAQALDAFDHQFVPAWQKLYDYLTGKYAAAARPKAGIGSLPGGREMYATLVRHFTTTSLSPEEIHKLGEAEVQRIETAMTAVARETGFAGSLTDFEKNLHSWPDQRFHSKEEMLVYCRNIAKQIEPQLPNLFSHIPVLLYGVRAISADREAATATNAQAPPPDFSAPGWFNLNTYQPENQYKYDKESLVLHEAVPGHIFQITLAQAQQGLPDFRKFYGNSAYVEGWALYAESLGSQLGVYKDPYSRFGQLASERFRAVRLVVDTGIHAMGWTREQAVDYFKTHAPGEQLAEVDRYIAWPGQALAYKLGELRIRALREEAEKTLGTKFDIREFHDAVLRDGTLPLDLLDEQVHAYIRQAAAR